MIITDWQGRHYDVEISYVPFLQGFVAWVDDDPYNEGEPFHSKREAVRHLTHEFGGKVLTDHARNFPFQKVRI